MQVSAIFDQKTGCFVYYLGDARFRFGAEQYLSTA
jgi:hypothetical protein